MDYSEMSTPDLQAECRRRGLPSGRVKADLVARLAEHDAAAGEPAAETPAEAEIRPADDTPEPEADAPTSPGVFRMSFPAEAGGPDEETHLAYRQATVQAAAAEGWQPRGDARLAQAMGERWVYEVLVRAVT